MNIDFSEFLGMPPFMGSNYIRKKGLVLPDIVIAGFKES